MVLYVVMYMCVCVCVWGGGGLEKTRTQKALILWWCVSSQISWQTQMSATGYIDMFTENRPKILSS